MEVLLFSLSISIDALGYSLGFGSKNVNIGLPQFFVLNLINTTILSLFLFVFSNFEPIFKNHIVSLISPILLALFGTYYVASAFYKLIVNNKSSKTKKEPKSTLKFSNFLIKTNNKKLKKMYCVNNNLSCIDLTMLFLVFIFENAFSTFVFYTSFNNAILFVVTNFIFHFFFFLLGFNLGKKIASKLNNHTSFVSGYIFLTLSYIELFL